MGVFSIFQKSQSKIKYYIDKGAKRCRVVSCGAGAKNVVIPETYMGYEVTIIDKNAFSGCKALESITLPNTLNCCMWQAFDGCKNLKSVYYNGTIEEWCKINFSNYDYDLKTYGHFHLSNPLHYGAKLYINGEELTSLTIPNDLTEIKEGAFEGCSSITSLEINSENLTNIDNKAFYLCSSLESVKISAKELTIGLEAFTSCLALKTLNLNGVVKICQDAFFNCKNLENVYLDNKLQDVFGGAFYDCKALQSIRYSGNVCEWNNVNFGGVLSSCAYDLYIGGEKLTDFSLSINNSQVKPFVFSNCKSITNLVIPNEITSVGKYAFSGCINLTEVVISDSVTFVGEGAFSDCVNLSYVQLGTEITTISSNMFKGDYKLKSILLPQSVHTIEKYAFSGAGLQEIVFPSIIKSIGERAFAHTEMTFINLPINVQSIEAHAFKDSKIKTIYYQGTSKAWRKVKVAGQFLTSDKMTQYMSESLNNANVYFANKQIEEQQNSSKTKQVENSKTKV